MSSAAYASFPTDSSRFQFLPDSDFALLDKVTGWTVDDGELMVRSGDQAIAIGILHDAMVRVRFSPDGVFTEDGPTSSYALDPNFESELQNVTVQDLEEALVIETSALTVRVNKMPCRVEFFSPDGTLIDGDSGGFGFSETDSGYQTRCWRNLVPDTHFYGLGDKTQPVDRRGHRFEMWNSDTYAFGPGQDPIYKSIPFFLGLHSEGKTAYGLFFDNSYRSFFDLGASSDSNYAFGAEGGEMRYYFFAGPTLTSTLQQYAHLTGRTPLPPKWALGYHQSRWNYNDAGHALWIAHEFRRKDIPLDAVHMDIIYMDGFRVFTWNHERFEDPPQLNVWLNELGVRGVVIIDPGVKVDPGYPIFDEALDKGYFAMNSDGTPFTGNVWPGDCHWPDFSNPAVRDWWGKLHSFFFDSGISGIWNDMNEPAILGGATFPDDVRFDKEGRGADHREIHNVYGLLMARSTFEGMRELRPKERPFLLTRASFSGSQRYAAGWTGDNVSTWEHLLLAITMSQSLAASGFPLCGADIGGFAGAPSPELYARWIQFALFQPYMRTHYSHENIDQQEPWSFGEEVEAISRKYIKLRYRLMTYIYSAFEEHSRLGTAPVRPLAFEYPEDARCRVIDDQFFFGQAFMAAPVHRQGHRSRLVYLPEGEWFDYWTAERFAGPVEREFEAPLDHMPLFVRAGSIIPEEEQRLSTMEDDGKNLTLHVFKGDGQSAVYFDDGISYEYEGGAFLRCDLSQCISGSNEIEIAVERTGSGACPHERFLWCIHGAQGTTVSVDGEPADFVMSRDELGGSGNLAFRSGNELVVATATNIGRIEIA